MCGGREKSGRRKKEPTEQAGSGAQQGLKPGYTEDDSGGGNDDDDEEDQEEEENGDGKEN